MCRRWLATSPALPVWKCLMSEPIPLRVFGAVSIPHDLTLWDAYLLIAALLGCPCPICGDIHPCSCVGGPDASPE